MLSKRAFKKCVRPYQQTKSLFRLSQANMTVLLILLLLKGHQKNRTSAKSLNDLPETLPMLPLRLFLEWWYFSRLDKCIADFCTFACLKGIKHLATRAAGLRCVCWLVGLGGCATWCKWSLERDWPASLITASSFILIRPQICRPHPSCCDGLVTLTKASVRNSQIPTVQSPSQLQHDNICERAKNIGGWIFRHNAIDSTNCLTFLPLDFLDLLD